MESRIDGTTMPTLTVSLGVGEHLISTHGGLAWMTPAIELGQTTHAGGGGIMKTLKRTLGGGGLLLTKFEAKHAPGKVTFGTKVPGTIFPLEIGGGSHYLVHREGWICATPGIAPSVGFQHSIRGAVFGGDGFILEKLEGEGTAWVELAGEMTVLELQAGEELLVHPGHVGVFEGTVKFQVKRLKGIVNRYFGDDGFHLVHLTGPGKIWLQSMPLPILAAALQPLIVPDDKD